jgi:energy-coupling factor transport system permease protein
VNLHQGAWIAWATAAAVATIVTTNPFYLLVITAIAWLVHAAQSVPGPSTRSFKVFVVFALVAIVVRTALVLVTPLVPQAGPITTSSFLSALLEGARLGTLLIVFGTFNSVSDPFALLKLAPRRFHEMALASALALSIAPRTIAVAAQVREAQKMRGIDTSRRRGLRALAIPVLETGMEDALTLAESMDARGHGRGRRSRYRPERWNVASLGVAIGALLTAVAFGAAFFEHRGALSVSLFPIAWPSVSLWLLAALAALAVPALTLGDRS